VNRTTRCLSERDRLPDAWFTVPSGATISLVARNANRFRLRLTTNAVLEPPVEPHSGQEIILRIEQDEVGGRTLAPNVVGITTRGSLVLNTAAGAVSVWKLLYDDEAKTWDAVGVPDLSSLYATPASVAAAQTAAEAHADAGDATTLATAEAYTDSAITALNLGTASTHAATDFDAAGAADAAVAAIPNQQVFSGATLSASIVGGQYVVGSGTQGIPSRNAQPLTLLVVQAQVALALLTSVTVKVVNFTQATSASVTITAGETYHRATINLAKAVNDEIGLLVDSVTGAPSAGIFNVFAL